MKYEGVKEWIESKKPEVYDFVEDTQRNLMDNRSNDYRKLESYEKFFIYKYGKGYEPIWSSLAGLKEELESAKEFVKSAERYQIGDPDSESMLLQKIYNLFWGDLVKKSFMRKSAERSWMVEAGSDGTVIASDNMTSAVVRFTDAMQQIISNTNTIPVSRGMSKDREEVIKQICKIYKECGSRQQWWSTNFSITVVAVLDEMEKREFSEMIYDQYPAMRKFLDLCHTIGNYCPVPVDFNANRSGRAVHDYWDLTLMKIRKWYREKDDAILVELLHQKGCKLSNKELKKCENAENCKKCGALTNCKEWLIWFEKNAEEKGKKDGWHNFVDTLFMQDYVKDYEKGNYEVKPFWEGHTWETPKLTFVTETEEGNDNLNVINKRLEEINRRVVARSNRIVDACNVKLKEIMDRNEEMPE